MFLFFFFFSLSLRIDFHCRVIVPCERTLNLHVNEIEAMYERPRVNAKVERGSTFTFARDLSNIVSILFTPVKFTCVHTEK